MESKDSELCLLLELKSHQRFRTMFDALAEGPAEILNHVYYLRS